MSRQREGASSGSFTFCDSSNARIAAAAIAASMSCSDTVACEKSIVFTMRSMKPVSNSPA
ncbi:hypothetical protein D3C83_236980 [compost metagenome]